VPEGDTVFRTARQLAEALTGKSLLRGELRHPRLSTVDLAGRVVVGVRSVGKHLFLRFDRDLSLHCHLGIDGSWRFYGAGGRRWRGPNHQARAVLVTEELAAVGLNLHSMALLATPEEHRLVDHLGPDLLDPHWSDEHAAEAVRRLTGDPDREIGMALLDQTAMAGVGNVYKAELCFLLGVSPWTPVSEVDAARAVALSRKLLLRNALRANRNTTGEPGHGRNLWVYGRTRTGCLRCGGPVVAGTQGSELRERVTYFCPHCQPGPHP
jgi:endonuclease-8